MDPALPLSPLQSAVVAMLKSRANPHAQVIAVTLDELAGELGLLAADIELVLAQLVDDGFFEGESYLSDTQFTGTLPS